eukprot:TRINITY_DN20542_c0_g1_i1.p1 TRINITY_DN20542_c0_g1~~TRINITY_DN20542_c0_g1_i1.p1  ORF type:complete len:141 (+),score=50.84 TRINITY_DN20542_c0_g1_i1:62-484(+)
MCIRDRSSYIEAKRERLRRRQATGEYTRPPEEHSTSAKFLSQTEIDAKLSKLRRAEEVLRFYEAHKFTFSAENVVAALHRLAKAKFGMRQLEKDERAVSLLRAAELAVPNFGPVESVLALWSLASLKLCLLYTSPSPRDS